MFLNYSKSDFYFQIKGPFIVGDVISYYSDSKGGISKKDLGAAFAVRFFNTLCILMSLINRE